MSGKKQSTSSSESDSDSSLDRKISRYLKRKIRKSSSKNKRKRRNRRHSASSESESSSSSSTRSHRRRRKRRQGSSDTRGYASSRASHSPLPTATPNSVPQDSALPAPEDKSLSQTNTSGLDQSTPGTEVETTPHETPKLGEDILKVIEPRYPQELVLSDAIPQEIADRWEDIVKAGLPDEERSKLPKTYATPENCLFIDPPKLNPTIKDSFDKDSPVLKRDKRIVERQERIAAAIGATSIILNETLKKLPKEVKLIDTINQTGRILADLQHEENNIRKNLLVSNLNNNLRETLNDGVPDQFLFGKDLDERVKAREAIERASKKLKPVAKAANSKNAKSPSRAKNQRATPSSGHANSASQKTLPPSKKDHDHRPPKESSSHRTNRSSQKRRR
ncbi:hypothetical protein QAD02_015857 [Eretmocerus hayati]|uniref:Uncharacterized protein n=1 Tax=Eretmocerus hayati TaxID=131215 RepID=A0ACC2PE78_9HYME|nr:hypothetical protein QAD02_015857 [Eretmocerus hayati]